MTIKTAEEFNALSFFQKKAWIEGQAPGPKDINGNIILFSQNWAFVLTYNENLNGSINKVFRVETIKEHYERSTQMIGREMMRTALFDTELSHADKSLFNNKKNTMAPVKSLQEYQAITAAHDGKTFFQLQMERHRKDPNNEDYQHAQEVAKARAKNFMDVLKNQSLAGHASAMNKYINTYNSDPETVYADLLKETCKTLNASPVEWENKSIEENIMGKYTIATSNDEIMVGKFRQLAKAKIDAEGHTGMDEFENYFWATHPHSSQK